MVPLRVSTTTTAPRPRGPFYAWAAPGERGMGEPPEVAGVLKNVLKIMGEMRRILGRCGVSVEDKDRVMDLAGEAVEIAYQCGSGEKGRLEKLAGRLRSSWMGRWLGKVRGDRKT